MSLVANTGKLAGRTIFITGASRGIGKTLALKAARDGANIVIAAKTAEPHPKLPGTIYTAAEEIEALGGKALPCVVDVRDEKQIQKAIDEAVKKFNGIDILVNNASATSLAGTEHTDMKKFDLMHSINTRGTFLVSKLCVPFLKNSDHAHILNMSPPLNLNPYWFSSHVGYTMAKYGMSMCALGMSEEFRKYNIAVNALWPRTAIATAATEMLAGDTSTCRKPDIVSDAAYAILCKDPKTFTGNFAIDDEILTEAGVRDFTPYASDPKRADNLLLHGFVDRATTQVRTRAALRQYHTSAVRYSEKPPPASGEIPTLFDAIGKTITPELVKKTQAVYQIKIQGKEEGVWHLDLKNGDGAWGQGEPKAAPDATLTMDGKNFAALFAGKLKPATAYMMGKLKISGDLQKAMKLELLMKSLKKKA